MEDFAFELLRQLPLAIFSGLSLAWELRGSIAEEALKLVFLPFHEFSVASCVVAAGWVVIFWRNKGLVLSGLSHMYHATEWLMKIIQLGGKNAS